ncbi:MAG: response regulator, partial [Candidatus Krumholzibacteria bacterium]|nr:response regulator [Candidatus Krumholzibacteria bacterium]
MKHVSEILIVDDDEEFVADLLRYWRAPLAVRIARSGKEAIKYLRARVPRLVLLDLKLPRFLGTTDELEGQALLADLKSRPEYKCPVVVVTQETSPDVKSRMLASGAAAYLTKPVDVSELEG